MIRKLAALIVSGSLLIACGPLLRPVAGPAEFAGIDSPSRGEETVASVIGYVAGGLPPVVLAGLAACYGWTVPAIIAFAIGGAAYSLLNPPDTSRAERVPTLLRAVAGGVRGLVGFPAMMGYAGKKVYGPFIARGIHELRYHR